MNKTVFTAMIFTLALGFSAQAGDGHKHSAKGKHKHAQKGHSCENCAKNKKEGKACDCEGKHEEEHSEEEKKESK